jgi:hypothetical protein
LRSPPVAYRNVHADNGYVASRAKPPQSNGVAMVFNECVTQDSIPSTKCTPSFP